MSVGRHELTTTVVWSEIMGSQNTMLQTGPRRYVMKYVTIAKTYSISLECILQIVLLHKVFLSTDYYCITDSLILGLVSGSG